jgi:type I restriction enzyme R subunit
MAEWVTQPVQLRARLREVAPARRVRAVERAGARDSQPRGLVFPRQPARADSDGDGFGEDVHRRQHRVPAAEVPGARRILFLVDRANLGKQTEDEFANFEPPDDPRKFQTPYTVQRLKTNSINPAAKVVITTIQRLYSMLTGDPEFDAGNEEGSAFDSARPWQGDPPDVAYNPGIPPESFDFIIVDECHRSLYELWSQVLLYFDSLP